MRRVRAPYRLAAPNCPVCPPRTTLAGCQDYLVRRSVLVVDDDPAFRRLACRIIHDMGLEVAAEAGTIAAALAAAELHFDAALVDIGLPDGDGTTLAMQLAALPWQPRVVLTSTDPEAMTPDASRSVGAVGFVPKADLADSPLRLMLAGE